MLALAENTPGSTGEHETKFAFDAQRAHQVESWLRRRCRPDGAHPAGTISSIYFDTPDWRMLAEKENGDHVKSKVRLRWYGTHPDGRPLEAAFLEVKAKRGALRAKAREAAALTGPELEAIALEDRTLLAVRRRLSPEIVSYGPLEPVFVIRYARLRFVDVETGLRVSLDRDIRVPRANRRRLPRSNPFRLRRAVVEIKGASADLPPSLQGLRAFGLRREAFSKYLHAYRQLKRSPE